MRIYRVFLAVLLQLLCIAGATPLIAAPTHIAPRLAVESPVAPGGTVTVALEMRPEKGWHGYWKNPGDAGFGTRLEWALPPGFSASEPAYPVPRTLLIAGPMNHVYEEDHALLVTLKAPATALPGSRLPLRLRAEWLACTDQICVPERAELAADVVVGAPGSIAPADPRFDAWRTRLPAPLGSAAAFALAPGTIRLAIPLPRTMPLASPHLFVAEPDVVDYAAPQDFRRRGDLLLISLKRKTPAAAAPARLSGVLSLDAAGNGVEVLAHPGPVPQGGEPLSVPGTGATNLAWLLLAALAGGLLLNVMPCVFPILSLKALSLARAGESAADAGAEGLAYTAGVVLACAGLGALLLALRAGGAEVGWAFQLQEPGVVPALLLVAVAITANLAGLYEFAVPGFAREGSKEGAFATGLLAAFVATPCTGPFMAAAMGAALLLPAAEAMALFVALGLGLALPFLAIALIPPLRSALPRPGRWMGRLRRLLAVPMGLTALALAWLALRLGGALFAGIAVALAAALALVLGAAGWRQRNGRSARALVCAGLVAVGLAAIASLPAAVRAPGAEAAGVLPSEPFSEQALTQARASGRPVFAYFTADWCLTCKVNESVAIEREPTRAAFARHGVVVLRGDWTRRDPAIARFLSAHGAAGVPLYLWYPPGGEAQVLPQLLGPELLPHLADSLSARNRPAMR